jgi:hypothetical protein
MRRRVNPCAAFEEIQSPPEHRVILCGVWRMSRRAPCRAAGQERLRRLDEHSDDSPEGAGASPGGDDSRAHGDRRLRGQRLRGRQLGAKTEGATTEGATTEGATTEGATTGDRHARLATAGRMASGSHLANEGATTAGRRAKPAPRAKRAARARRGVVCALRRVGVRGCVHVGRRGGAEHGCQAKRAAAQSPRGGAGRAARAGVIRVRRVRRRYMDSIRILYIICTGFYIQQRLPRYIQQRLRRMSAWRVMRLRRARRRAPICHVWALVSVSARVRRAWRRGAMRRSAAEGAAARAALCRGCGGGGSATGPCAPCMASWACGHPVPSRGPGSRCTRMRRAAVLGHPRSSRGAPAVGAQPWVKRRHGPAREPTADAGPHARRYHKTRCKRRCVGERRCAPCPPHPSKHPARPP